MLNLPFLLFHPICLDIFLPGNDIGLPPNSNAFEILVFQWQSEMRKKKKLAPFASITSIVAI